MCVADIHAAWRGLPMGSLDDIIGGGTCLVLSPHPDDESLGCGGLIAACAADGRPPIVAILTDGTGSHPQSRKWPPERLKALRYQEVTEAVSRLGLSPDRLVFLDARDTQAPTEGPAFDAAANRLLDLMHGMTAILAPWRFDPHADHVAAGLLAARVAKEAGIRHVAYPVWGWCLPPDDRLDEERPVGWRLDIQPWRNAKQAAIAAHRSQHGKVVDDDPQAFALTAEFLAVFDTPFETFLMS
ncbi:MAG TPA: PIG-L deacetylase family protein [Rhodopila sp.]|jgi:LmbE family N-acetylglucosaminyl deacetylase|nr:PIG-L deacetylase family protein [Rhodopila sp.]